MVNNNTIRSKNKSSNTIFLTKSRNLSKSRSTKTISESNFLTFNTKKVFNILR